MRISDWSSDVCSSDLAGRKVYQEYCASCHGPRGEGQANWEAPNDQGELPAPPHNAEGHTWKHADAMLYRMVSEGWRDPFNKTRELTMPAFGDQLSPEQIREVVTYLKTRSEEHTSELQSLMRTSYSVFCLNK